MSQQLRVTRKVDFTGATQIGVGSSHIFGAGNVLYVNGESSYGPTANDGHDGKNPNYPLATITQALTLCEDRHNDYIFVMGSYQTDTFPLSPAARNVHIIGLGGGGFARSRALLDGDDAAAFQLETASGGLELAGLRMGSSDAAYAAIVINTTCMGCHVHDCTFGVYIPATDGIYAHGAGAHMQFWTIENCLFGTSLTGDGIDVQNMNRIYILNNYFLEYGGVGIIIDNGTGDMIVGNRFSKTADFTAGDAITLGGSTAGIYVDDNRAAEDGAAPGNVPFIDKTTADQTTLTNAWGVNWSGDAVTYPGDSADA
jgi:hypothetical protein